MVILRHKTREFIYMREGATGHTRTIRRDKAGVYNVDTNETVESEM